MMVSHNVGIWRLESITNGNYAFVESDKKKKKSPPVATVFRRRNEDDFFPSR